jgi:hypothetical protein
MNGLSPVTAVVTITVLIVCSCAKKAAAGYAAPQKETYSALFAQKEKNRPDKLHDDDYYRNKAINYRDMPGYGPLQYNLESLDYFREAPQIIPGFLNFIAIWNDMKGYTCELYLFDAAQEVANYYLCASGPALHNYQDKLMENMPGKRIEHTLVSVGDFNGDGIDEILSYSYIKMKGYMFCVRGFNAEQGGLKSYLERPIYINFEEPFCPVKTLEKGFSVLEIVDEEPLSLQWERYGWDEGAVAYTREKGLD